MQSNLLEYFKLLESKLPEATDLIASDSAKEIDVIIDSYLIRGIHHLEKNKKNFKELKEEGLSAVLAAYMTLPGVTVTQETNSNGHVDITISIEFLPELYVRLAEAKIWRGAEYHIQGLEQLIHRYTTGREGKGIMISFVKTEKIKKLFEKLKEAMNQNKPCDQIEDCKDSEINWAFQSKHEHNSGEEIEVFHVGCNLYLEQGIQKEN